MKRLLCIYLLCASMCSAATISAPQAQAAVPTWKNFWSAPWCSWSALMGKAAAGSVPCTAAYASMAASFVDYTGVNTDGRGSPIELLSGEILITNTAMYNNSYSAAQDAYDPVTDVYRKVWSDTRGLTNQSYADKVLLPNGKVFWMPQYDSKVCIMDTSVMTQTEAYYRPATIFGAVVNISSSVVKFIKCIPVGHSKVILIPNSANKTFGIYNYALGTYMDGAVATSTTYTSYFSGSGLMANGKILLTPDFQYKMIGIYDPDTELYSEGPRIPAPYSVSMPFTLRNGLSIFFEDAKVYKYNPWSNTVTSSAITAGWAPKCLLPSGNVLMFKSATLYLGEYNPTDNSITQTTSTAGDSNFIALPLSDGRVFINASQYFGSYVNTDKARMYTPMMTGSFSRDLTLSPLLNQ